MILTGKCKNDFNTWRFDTKNYRRIFVAEYNDLIVLHLAIEWFDSLGIWTECFQKFYHYANYPSEKMNWKQILENAVREANTIYNNKPK